MTWLASLPRRQRELVVAAAWLGLLVLAIAALAPLRSDLETGTPALVLLTASLLAAFGSLRLSIVSAVVGALAFNFWFTEPIHNFRIASDASVVAFVVYLIVAVAAGVVIGRLRVQTEATTRRADEATLLRDLTLDLVRQSTWLQPPVASALAELVRALGLRGAAVSVDIAGGESLRARAGDAGAAMQAAEVVSPGTEADRLGIRSLHTADGVTTWPITSSSTHYGMLAIDSGEHPDPAHEQVARLFANVVALACERASLVQRTLEQRTLEETDRVRVALVQSVTHDLRTPLTSIRALASALPSIAPIAPEQAELLVEIETQADRLTRLVDQVLDLGRIDSGQLVARRDLLAIDDSIRAAVDAARTAGVDLQVQLDPDLPRVPIDEPLVVQVLSNLVENAARHGAAPFELRASRAGDFLELRIVDHGRGIPEAERRRLFDPGHAMRRGSADARSRGLGLAIGAGFVAAHRGQLRVEPTPGGGATFVVRLPITEGAR